MKKNKNDFNDLANRALSEALQEFGRYKRHWITRYDPIKRRYLYFFPLYYVNQFKSDKIKFIRILKRHWEECGFKVTVHEHFSATSLYKVSYESLLFQVE